MKSDLHWVLKKELSIVLLNEYINKMRWIAIHTAVASFAILFSVSLSIASHLWAMWPISVDFPWSTWPMTTMFRKVLMTSRRLDGWRGRRGFSINTFSLGDISLSEEDLSDTEWESSDGMLMSASSLGSSKSKGQRVK